MVVRACACFEYKASGRSGPAASSVSRSVSGGEFQRLLSIYLIAFRYAYAFSYLSSSVQAGN